MNVQAGDLAVVIRSEIGNEGRVVRVVRRLLAGESHLADGSEVRSDDDWVIEGRLLASDMKTLLFNGVPQFSWDSPVYEFEGHMPFPDACLRPIRDQDGEDEMLRIAGKPSDTPVKETSHA